LSIEVAGAAAAMAGMAMPARAAAVTRATTLFLIMGGDPFCFRPNGNAHPPRSPQRPQNKFFDLEIRAAPPTVFPGKSRILHVPWFRGGNRPRFVGAPCATARAG